MRERNAALEAANKIEVPGMLLGQPYTPEQRLAEEAQDRAMLAVRQPALRYIEHIRACTECEKDPPKNRMKLVQ